jgi:hypothetical protein
MSYTKGGWGRNIKPAAHYPVIFAGRNTHVARVISVGLTSEEIEANCDLIACAPDLLESLQAMCHLATHHALDDAEKRQILQSARAVIARATGVQS